MARLQVKEHVIPCQHLREYPNATKHRQEAVLRLCIKQYVPIRDSEPGENAITIIAAHATGFPKEVYEPLWDDLLDSSQAHGFEIRAIWAADTSNQGASGVLNEEIQGDDTSWFDHSRDLLGMVNHFREQMPRPIVGFAHSLGCAQLVHLSLMHPRLLSTLILIEPIIQMAEPPGPVAAMMSSFRPDLWSSRKAAQEAFVKNKFFNVWDKRVLDKYLTFGLRQVPTAIYPISSDGRSVPPGAVTLTTSKHQEAWSYVRSNFEPQNEGVDRLLSPDTNPEEGGRFPFTRAEALITHTNLPHVRPNVLYIYGATSPINSPALNADRIALTGVGVGGSGGAKKGKVSELVIAGRGHMVPCEDTRGCAEHAAGWLGRWNQQHKADEDFHRNYINRKSVQGMLKMSDEWKRRVREPTSLMRPVKGKL